MRRFKNWSSFDDSGEFDLRVEAVDWGARIGSLLLMVSVFSPVIGSMRQSQSYMEYSPRSAFLIILLAAMAFVAASRRKYGQLCGISVACAAINLWALLGLMLYMMNENTRLASSSLTSIYNIPDFGAKIELKDGVFLVLIGNLSIYFAASSGEPQ